MAFSTLRNLVTESQKYFLTKKYAGSTSASISSFFENCSEKRKLDQRRLNYAVEETERIFRFQRVRVYHFNDAYASYDNWSSRPGWPWCKYYDTKADVPKHAVRTAVHRFKYRNAKLRAPCKVISLDKLISTKPDKTRLVWQYPIHHVMLERMFTQPLSDYLARINNEIFPLNVPSYRVQIPPSNYLTLDFSQYDSSLPSWLILLAFRILEKYLDFERYEFRGQPSDPAGLRAAFWKCAMYYIHTPFFWRRGVIYKSGGTPSGSSFTTLINTLCNSIICHYSLYTIRRLYIFGDDVVIGLPELAVPSLSEIASSVKSSFGVTLNSEKCEVTTEPKFLGLVHTSRGLRPDLPKLMASLRLKTRVGDPEYNNQRAIGLLVASLFNVHFEEYLLSLGYNVPSTPNIESLRLQLTDLGIT